MRRSIGLTAYRSLIRQRKLSYFEPSCPRPEGELIWIHAAEAGENRPIDDLAFQILQIRGHCNVLVTTPYDPTQILINNDTILDIIPGEHPLETDAFIKHWRPDVVIWAWGGLRPNLIQSAAESGAHMMLIDAAEDGFESRIDRWLPEIPKYSLAKFKTVMARSEKAKLRLIKLGCNQEKIILTNPLSPFGHILEAADSDLNDFTHAVTGRPVWLAMQVTHLEAGTILAAHSQALMIAHRLLVILHPSNLKATQDILTQAKKAGLRVICWSSGNLPDENTQVLIADTTEDLGLWLRLAPVSFLGGSLYSGEDSCDPYMAAAHGTAIIYGPHTGRNVEAYTNLVNAGAARIVNDSATLADAVIQMIAPDQAAQMAVAGWDFATEGIENIEKIIGYIDAELSANNDGQTD